MAKLTRILHVFFILGLVLMAFYPKHMAFALQEKSPINPAEGMPESYKQVAENKLFILYVDEEALSFNVLDKRSGYLWHSSLDETIKTDRLNKSWKAFARSGLSIEYLDPKAVNKRISITNSTHQVKVQNIDHGISAEVKFTDFGITVGINIQLEDNGVSVEVPSASIKEENPDFKLGLIYIQPFLGATRADSTLGYMLIPDGSGSLIRYTATTKAKNMFYGRIYGPDLGMISSLPWDPTITRPYQVSVPVYGVQHGEKQNAFVSIVEKGASYGEIQAHPSGIITNFNFIYNAFVYNESYFQATNRSGAGVTTLQKETNQFDIKIHYRFLTAEMADYVGMARSYQQYLLEQGILKKNKDQGTDIGIRLEFLGGDKERVLFWDRLIPMTTVTQMSNILHDMRSLITNTDVVYYGWQPLGAASMPPTSMKLDATLGSLADLRKMAQEIAAGGGRFYLYLDPQAAVWHESGYSPRNDLAMSITKTNLDWYNRYKANYYFNLEALSPRFTNLRESVFKELGTGLALDGIGYTAYSDFKNGHLINREGSIHAYQELLAKTKTPTPFYIPNDYAFGSMSAYYDMPISSNGYIYTSESVPFLEIVLAGCVPYYGPALNFSSNLREDLLRQVDYGVYPAYFLSQEVTARILNTSSSWIYTSSYAQWKEEIHRTYQWMNNLLSPVRGQEIVARQTLAQGVSATTYANGRQIIVNYNDSPIQIKGVSINAKDAVILEVQP